MTPYLWDIQKAYAKQTADRGSSETRKELMEDMKMLRHWGNLNAMGGGNQILVHIYTTTNFDSHDVDVK